MPVHLVYCEYLWRPNGFWQGMPSFYLLTTSTSERHDTDCSGRSLATILIAWVGAAMVASVLLRWKYMWIVLAILTLLFLVVCGYTACNARRTERAFIREAARQADNECRDIGGRDIQSVAGRINHVTIEIEPPSYQPHWISDLPPPYSSVVGVQTAPTFQSQTTVANNPQRTVNEEQPGATGVLSPRISNPPPYSVAIESSSQTIANSTPVDTVFPLTLSENVPSRPAIHDVESQSVPDHQVVNIEELEFHARKLSNDFADLPTDWLNNIDQKTQDIVYQEDENIANMYYVIKAENDSSTSNRLSNNLPSELTGSDCASSSSLPLPLEIERRDGVNSQTICERYIGRDEFVARQNSRTGCHSDSRPS